MSMNSVALDTIDVDGLSVGRGRLKTKLLTFAIYGV